ncbi:MAG TPA: 2-amino-4-hydroxy-6-hydroxymethyldihydropteridine diphosphokinase [Gemmatimonadales bacterium]|nr:2-amino-4-hydroxy-6-hydroxymethyldihydropteridine diphosphokinase [Gemmatimonadales bacterium]
MAAPRERVYVALGSNLGDRAAHLAAARAALGRLTDTTLVAASRAEETAPLGGMAQPAYLNQMVLLETALAPHELLAECQRIERERGRVRGERWAPRTLDLDIVCFGERHIADGALTVPHPGLADRDFWRRELSELRSHEP